MSDKPKTRAEEIADKHMRSRAKEITLAIMDYVKNKETEKQDKIHETWRR